MEVFHLLFLGVAVLAIAVADKKALAWMRGKVEIVPAKSLDLAHYVVWIGLSGLIVTGSIMATSMIEFLIKEPAFLIKMMFVGVLITNGFLISSLMKVAYKRSFASLNTEDKLLLLFSGAVSTISWAAAITIGFFFL